jgi:hypothetical protein
MALSDLLVRAAANTEKSQPAFFITKKITQCIYVGFIQPDDPILFIERKAHRRFGGPRRRIRGGETSERDVMIDEMFALHFEIKTFCADAVPANKLS